MKLKLTINLLKVLFVVVALIATGNLDAKQNYPKDIPANWHGFIKGIPVTVEDLGVYSNTSEYDGGLVHWFHKEIFYEYKGENHTSVRKYLCEYIIPVNPIIGDSYYASCGSYWQEDGKYGPADYDYTFQDWKEEQNF